jgi:hypothetical protein
LGSSQKRVGRLFADQMEGVDVAREDEITIDCSKVQKLICVDCKLKPRTAEKLMNISHSVFHAMMGGAKSRPLTHTNTKTDNAMEVILLARRILGRSKDELTLEDIRWTQTSGRQAFGLPHDPNTRIPRPTRRLASSSTVPTIIAFTTQRANPQWADYRDCLVEMACPWVLRCLMATESPYFRFGFKLLTDHGRVFGDGLIQSYDANMVIHIGRNDFGRPRMGITEHDVFLTTYMNGIAIEDDKILFRADQKLTLPIELLVDETYRVSLSVNGQLVSQRIVPPVVCGRMVILAWGDREEFQVDVTDLIIEPVGQ